MVTMCSTMPKGNKILKTTTYKGHKIELIEDVWGQRMFYVDGDRNTDYFTMADAKRAINGEQTRLVNIEW